MFSACTHTVPLSAFHSKPSAAAPPPSKSECYKGASQESFQSLTRKRKTEKAKPLKSRRATKRRITREKRKMEVKNNIQLQQNTTIPYNDVFATMASKPTPTKHYKKTSMTY
jgi:hypothetical protein